MGCAEDRSTAEDKYVELAASYQSDRCVLCSWACVSAFKQNSAFEVITYSWINIMWVNSLQPALLFQDGEFDKLHNTRTSAWEHPPPPPKKGLVLLEETMNAEAMLAVKLHEYWDFKLKL